MQQDVIEKDQPFTDLHLLTCDWVQYCGKLIQTHSKQSCSRTICVRDHSDLDNAGRQRLVLRVPICWLSVATTHCTLEHVHHMYYAFLTSDQCQHGYNSWTGRHQ